MYVLGEKQATKRIVFRLDIYFFSFLFCHCLHKVRTQTNTHSHIQTSTSTKKGKSFTLLRREDEQEEMKNFTIVECQKNTHKHIQTNTRTSYSRIILPIPTRGEVHIYIQLKEKRRNGAIPCVCCNNKVIQECRKLFR